MGFWSKFIVHKIDQKELDLSFCDVQGEKKPVSNQDETKQDIKGQGDDLKIKIELLKFVNEHFRNDINAIWVRGTYFSVINAAMISYYFSSDLIRSDDAFFNVFFIIVAAFTGITCWVTILSAKWINVWRNAVVDLEAKIFKFGPYSRGEAIGNSSEKIRPEHIAVFSSVSLAAIWVVIFIYSLCAVGGADNNAANIICPVKVFSYKNGNRSLKDEYCFDFPSLVFIGKKINSN